MCHRKKSLGWAWAFGIEGCRVHIHQQYPCLSWLNCSDTITPKNIQGSLSMLINLNPFEIYRYFYVFFYSQTPSWGFVNWNGSHLSFLQFFFLLIALFCFVLGIGYQTVQDVNVIVTEFNNKLSKNILVSRPPAHALPPIVLESNNHHLYKSVLKIQWQVTFSTNFSSWKTKNIFHSPSDLFSLSNAITGFVFLCSIVPTFTDFNIVEVLQRHKYSRIQYSKKYKIKLI